MKTLELLQDGIYHAAKNEKNRKFYSLHDKICRLDVVEDAWKRVSGNGGSPGIDRKSIEDIRNYGVSRFLEEIQKELMNMTYIVPEEKPVTFPRVTESIVSKLFALRENDVINCIMCFGFQLFECFIATFKHFIHVR